MSVSLCMIAKNEGLTIRRALESAKPFVDEYIIGIDSLSKDNTTDEVWNFLSENNVNARFYTFKWENDFSKARNECIERANGDWIFILDGHETVVNPDKIKKIKSNGISDYDVYLLNIEMNENGYQSMFQQERLFRKEYKYHNKTHNVLIYNTEKVAKIMDVTIKHERSNELIQDRLNQRNFINLCDLNLRLGLGDNRAKSQIIQEYMANKDWNNAILHIKEYLPEDIKNAERYQVLIKLAMCYYYTKEYAECEYYLVDSARFNEDKRNAHLVFLGELYNKTGYYDKSKEVLIKALEIKKPDYFWYLYPKFYYKTPLSLLKTVESKIDNNNFTGNN